MDISKKLEAIKKVLFNTDAPAPAPEQPASFAEYTLKDGTVVSISELAVGGTAMIGDQPAPAGTHELADGGSITVGEGGVITGVDIESGEDMGKDKKQDYSEQFAAIEGRFAQMESIINKQAEMYQHLEAAFTQSGETMKQLLEVVEQLAKAPTADPAEAPKQNFRKDAPLTKTEKFAGIAKAIASINN